MCWVAIYSADGSSFPLKFTPTAGFTYNMSATLRGADSAAAHLRLSIYPPESISTADDAGSADSLGCDLPPEFSEPAHDVGEIPIGSFTGPTGGRQSWGEVNCETGNAPGCCEDPSRVGPPEAPCDGNYRHFPGQDFGPSGSWTWTAPMTGEYILLVTANCDVPLFSDPTQPGCLQTVDGLDCEDEAVENCAAGIDLTITSSDTSIRLTHTFEVPIFPGLIGSGRRALQNTAGGAGQPGLSGRAASGIDGQLAALSSIFRTDQLSGLAFPTGITAFDCDVREHRERQICVANRGRGSDGSGHRRRLRRLQGSCPHADFIRREVEMLTACGLTSDVAADAAVLGSVACPSLACAEAMTSLLDDCAGSIEHLAEDCTMLVDASCGQNRAAAAYYRELERSAVFVGCEETEETHAEFAEVEVEFRAPSLAAANQMVRTHEAMVAVLSQPGGCGSDGRRRVLTGDDDQSCESCEAELAQAQAAVAAAQKTAAKEVAAARAATATATARAEAAEAALAAMVQQGSVRGASAPNLPARRRVQHVNVTNATASAPVPQQPTLEARADATSGEIMACIGAPCTILGVCLNGGACEEVTDSTSGNERWGLNDDSFRCSCPVDYYGPRCATRHECLAEPCQNGGACFDAGTDTSITAGTYYCSCDREGGWEGVNCEGNIDECESSPCRNGGACTDGVNGYTCDCGTDDINDRSAVTTGGMLNFCGENCDETDCTPLGVDPIADPVCSGVYITVPDDPAFMTTSTCSQPYCRGGRDDSISFGSRGPFGLGANGTAWYRLPANKGLPTAPTGQQLCGTYSPGWLTGWPAEAEEQPGHGDETPADGTLPPPVGSPPAVGTVCFGGCNPCDHSTRVRAVSCGAFALWELPLTVPREWSGEGGRAYCTADSTTVYPNQTQRRQHWGQAGGYGC